MNKNIIWVLVILLVAGGLIFLSRNSEEKEIMKTDTLAPEKDIGNVVDATSVSGSYESYSPDKIAKAENGNVVLFFHAAWCPECRALDKDIKANLENIPANLTILDVDYDQYSDLKKKYKVTYQHTMVQVDKDGNLLKKWSGSPTLASLVLQVQN